MPDIAKPSRHARHEKHAQRAKQRRAARDRRTLERLHNDFEALARDHPDHPIVTQWEREFLQSVPERIAHFGSAFADPSKRDPRQPTSALSLRQRSKLRELHALLRRRGRKAREESEAREPKTQPGC